MRWPIWPIAFSSLLVGASAIFKVFDADVFWHVETGKWIWTHHAVPTHDVLSYTAPGPLAYTETLAQLFFYGLDRAGGAHALTLGGATLAVGLALAVASLCGVDRDRSAAARVVATAWTALATTFRFGPKTELFSFIGFALLLRMLLAREHVGVGRAGRARWVGGIALLCFVWGNCHRGGAIAPVFIGAAACAWALRAQTRALAPAGLLAAFVAATALTLNSGGLRYFASAFRVGTSESLRAYFAQCRPVDFAFLAHTDPWALAMLLAWIASTAYRRRFDMETAVASLSLSLPVVGLRYLPFAAIAVAPGIARGVDNFARFVSRRLRRPMSPNVAPLSAVALCAAALAHQYVTRFAPDVYGTGILTWRLPVRAAAFLRDHPPQGGRMWNSYDFGGYLAYALGPDQKDFIDGRNETVFPEKFFEETEQASIHPEVLARQFDRYGVTYAVVMCSKLQENRFAQLYANPEWRLVFFDDVAAVLVKRTPAMEPYAYRSLSPVTALERVAALGAMDPAQQETFVTEAERALREAPDSIRAHVLWAGVLRAHGDLDGARSEVDLAREIARSRGVSLGVTL